MGRAKYRLGATFYNMLNPNCYLGYELCVWYMLNPNCYLGYELCVWYMLNPNCYLG